MIWVLDVETSRKPIFKPWQPGAFLSLVGLYNPTVGYKIWVFQHGENDGRKTFAENWAEINSILGDASLVVGHNLKFDLLWVPYGGNVFCTENAEYLIQSQQRVELGLDAVVKRYGFEGKDDIWNKYSDLNTDCIPLQELITYLKRDLCITYELYRKMYRKVPKALMSLRMETLKALTSIELCGMLLDERELDGQYRDAGREVERIDSRLHDLVGKRFNFNSPDQLSTALFGGTYNVGATEWFYKQYKSGKKLRSKRVQLSKPWKGLGFEPRDEWKAEKEGIWKTNETVLSQLRPHTPEQKEFLQLMGERRKLKKHADLIHSEKGGGLLDLVIDNRVHTEYTQCFTRTGRFSSAAPNLQNIPRGNTSPVKRGFISEEMHCERN